MRFFSSIGGILRKATALPPEKEYLYAKKESVEELGGMEMEEDLLSMKSKFYNGEDDECQIDKKRYMNNELSYMNRINSFHKWTKKPLHLCSILLAANGYICEDENTIKCEVCGCKYVYEKDKYSMYTQISDLCLLHEDHCPWKNKLMELSFFKLDEESLKREELLREYWSNVKMLEEALYEIPLLNVKKAIKNLQIIIKRHLEKDAASAQKYSIFRWYVNFFKSQFAPIFSKNENVIEKGIKKIEKEYPEYTKYVVDLAFIENLKFDICDENNFISILCDEVPFLEDDEEDVNMYLKIVAKMRNRTYEEMNIFKLLAFFGWSYKADFVDEDNNFTQILQCKYCFREVKISKFSSYLTRDKKLMLFKGMCSAAETKEVISDALSKKERLQKNRNIGNRPERFHNKENGGNVSYVNNSNDGDNCEVDWMSRIHEHMSSFFKEYDEMNISLKNSLPNKDDNNAYSSGILNDTPNVSKNGTYNEHQLITLNTGEGKQIEGTKDECGRGKEASESAYEEEPSFKWRKKKLILTKKDANIFKERSQSNGVNVINRNHRKSSLFAKKTKHKSEKCNTWNQSESSFRSSENCSKRVLIKNPLSSVCLSVSNYVKDETLFMKSIMDSYVLTDSNFFKLDENNSYEQNNKCIRTIRLFDVIENHRIYCPYITEDLHSFSKITKLFFELLVSEFQRRYVFNK